ncbi:MAG TPA: hypothetical protein PK624_14150 [Spirochaetota bacterium]|nr:hypothetical protein [Spirochaetota bacterium]HOR45932.1 hypothetical protein [Spirochaetota bacterium]HOU85519.1 hypothetical protein [Spirochaetota bacterium]HPK57526.1 hypothetical protein [Spirochaetota bacterium]HQE59360.1 hypothetical protein [Spirochaetota bacterium]
MKTVYKKIKCAFYVLGFSVTALIVSCGGGSDGGSNIQNKTDPVISSDETWENCEVIIDGMLTIKSGAVLTLKNVTLKFNAEVEDSTALTITNSSLVADNCTFTSYSDKQWNLEAYGNSTMTFIGTEASRHSGIRAHDNTVLNVESSKLEEIQCHDNVNLNISKGSQVYIVLFFSDSGTVSLLDGQLASGSNITRTFTYKSGAASTGTVKISSSDVWGFQLDIAGSTDLRVKDATDIVLALHLEDVGDVTINDNITSDSLQTGNINVSSLKFSFTDSQITYINTYVSGSTSSVTFSGTVKVVEANVWDGATLTFGANVTLLADLAQAYDTAVLKLNGVTLAEDGSFPSITAEDESTVEITGVDAIPSARIYSVGNGKVKISGGTGWKKSMCEEEKSGNITIN